MNMKEFYETFINIQLKNPEEDKEGWREKISLRFDKETIMGKFLGRKDLPPYQMLKNDINYYLSNCPELTCMRSHVIDQFTSIREHGPTYLTTGRLDTVCNTDMNFNPFLRGE